MVMLVGTWPQTFVGGHDMPCAGSLETLSGCAGEGGSSGCTDGSADSIGGP